MSTEDRRAPGTPRTPFDGLVEVGGALGPTFEAQALNVSEEGMHLRTAYLPEPGQQVTCRFETSSTGSVVGSAEVVWCRSAEKGGEFGIRFTDVDSDSVEALKRICGVAVDAAPIQRGSKVRLYIDGLASPMRAKITDARPTAVTVGSDLGFLQVGKQLELEDAQTGAKRPASIDRVDVVVDPSSHIPQLIVTLRYEDLPAPTEAPEPPGDPARADDLAAIDQASAQMKSALARQIERVGPALRRLAGRATMTVALLARRGVGNDSTPRRTTAPPPGGGLHAAGRRVVRGETSGRPGDEGGATTTLRGSKRKVALGVAVMAVAVAGGMAIKHMHHDAAPTASPTPVSPVEVASTPAVGVAPTAVAPANTVSPGPQSPTEASPQQALLASSQPSTAPEDSADPAHHAVKKHTRVTPFGNGAVHHGNVLRLKMDGVIEAIEGAQLPTGFTIKVPGRRSLEAASPLAARDSRIGVIKVNNDASGAELTVAFKDGVPNYQVSARGDTLIMTLAPAGPLEAPLAKRDDKSVRNGKHASRVRDAEIER